MLRTLFTTVFIVFIGATAVSETTLESYLVKNDVSLQWDALRGVGTLWFGIDAVTFRLDSPYYVLNFSDIHRFDAPKVINDEIILTETTVSFLDSFVFDDTTRIASRDFSRVRAIFIDPGHGGQDPGAVAKLSNGSSVYEKDIVLAVGLHLQEMLKSRFPDKEIHISRDSDTYVSLEERADFANAIELGTSESTLFVSIHVNASLNAAAQGFEVWYLPPKVVRKNLVSDTVAFGFEEDTVEILNRIKDEEVSIESVLFARSILSEMDEQIGHISSNRGIREESWYVVRNVKMPAVLVELGFISNTNERSYLIDESYQDILSRALFSGIESYILTVEGTE